ncbi:MAG: hypothetical protein F7B60_07710 [Desulfurococcales archaeon]|nr:hypothetical protein [Desulfurococcales archaeon]
MVIGVQKNKRMIYYIAIIVILLFMGIIFINNFYTVKTPSKSATSSTPPASHVPGQGSGLVNVPSLVKAFLANTSRFYLEHKEANIIDGFCRTLILHGKVVNATLIQIPIGSYKVRLINGETANINHISVSGGLYHYGLLAYISSNGNYWFARQLKLGGIVVTHISPLENITITGSFGPAQWFRISSDNTTKVLWFTSYPGVVYKDKVICSSEAIELKGNSIIIVRIFIVKTENVPNTVESSLWLVLSPIDTK